MPDYHCVTHGRDATAELIIDGGLLSELFQRHDVFNKTYCIYMQMDMWIWRFHSNKSEFILQSSLSIKFVELIRPITQYRFWSVAIFINAQTSILFRKKQSLRLVPS